MTSAAAWVDVHCHLSAVEDTDATVAAAHRDSIGMVVATTRPSEWRLLNAVYSDASRVEIGLGFHPEYAGSVYEDAEWAIFAASVAGCRWISEIGVDRAIAGAAGPAYGCVPSLAAQTALFERILSLLGAQHTASVHSAEAEDIVLEALSRSAVGNVVLHNFSGTAAQLDRAVDAGHYVSIGPHTPERIVVGTPLDRLLIETDAPFSTWAGRVSSPVDVPAIGARVAHRRGMALEQLEAALLANVARLRHRSGL